MSLNRETELRIAGLEWQEFEQLVFDLAFAEHPGAVKTTPPDLGADTLVFDDGEHGRHVFQAKNYRERIRWDACVESLDTSLAYGPARVTFVFPKDLNGNEMKSFDRKLLQRHEGVAVHLWSLSTLRALLDKHRHVLVGGLPANLSRVLDSLQPEASSANAIDRLLDQVGDLDDPDFQYAVTSGHGREAPPITPQRDSFISIRAVREQTQMNVLIEPREGVDEPIVGWRFRDDESGHRARMDALRDAGCGEEEVTIQDGIAPVWNKTPVVLKDAGALDEVTSQIRFTFRPGSGFDAKLTMSRDREQVEYPFTMYPFPPSPGFAYAYVGYKDGAMPVLEIRSIGPDRGEMHLRPLFDLTSDARQNVAALTFRSAFLNADEVTLTAELFDSNGMRIGRPADRTGPGVREEVEHALAIYEEVAFLEERLGVSLPVHNPPITAAEIQLLAHATATLRNRTGYGILGMAEWEVEPEQAEALRATLLSNPTISFHVNASILGHKITLGTASATFPDMRVVVRPPLLLVPNPMVKVAAYSSGDGRVAFRLLDDDEEPPPTTIRMPPLQALSPSVA